jgi:hypothetical protein
MSNKEHGSMARGLLAILVFLNILIIREAYIGNPDLYMALFVTVPLLLLVVYNSSQKEHA